MQNRRVAVCVNNYRYPSMLQGHRANTLNGHIFFGCEYFLYNENVPLNHPMLKNEKCTFETIVL